MRRLLLALALTLAITGNAEAATPTQRCVYMFGFAASFKDSVAYITDVQAIDTAYVFKNGFLADRSLYSMQLYSFISYNFGKDEITCAVFFGTKKSKIEKKYLKVRKKYKAEHAVVLTSLGRDTFEFKGEEWIAPSETDVPADKDAEKPKPEGLWNPPEGGEQRPQWP